MCGDAEDAEYIAFHQVSATDKGGVNGGVSGAGVSARGCSSALLSDFQTRLPLNHFCVVAESPSFQERWRDGRTVRDTIPTVEDHSDYIKYALRQHVGFVARRRSAAIENPINLAPTAVMKTLSVFSSLEDLEGRRFPSILITHEV